VDEQELVVLDAGNGSAVQPDVMAPGAFVFAQELSVGSVGKPVVGSVADFLMHTLAQGVDGIRRCRTRFAGAGQPVEWAVAKTHAFAAHGVAVGVITVDDGISHDDINRLGTTKANMLQIIPINRAEIEYANPFIKINLNVLNNTSGLFQNMSASNNGINEIIIIPIHPDIF